VRFIPDYRVSYKGRFYEAEEELQIDPADAEEMRRHGEVIDEPEDAGNTSDEQETADETADETAEESEPPAEERPRRGRRRRADDEPGKDAPADE